MASAAYRNLMRAARITFKGDPEILAAARAEIRWRFQQNAAMPVGAPATVTALHEADEVARFLRSNVVQGRREPDSHVWKLRIHEHTERGDNDTINVAEKTVKVDGRTCADR